MIRRARRPGARPRVLVLSAFAPELTELGRLLAGAGLPAALRDGVVCQPAGIGLVDAARGRVPRTRAARPGRGSLRGNGGKLRGRSRHRPGGGGAPAESGVRRPGARRRVPAPAAGPACAHRRGNPSRLVAGSGGAIRRARRGRRRGDAGRHHDRTGPRARPCPLERRRRGKPGGLCGGAGAAAAAIPFGAVLGISNRVGPHAHAQWRRHQDAAMRAVAATVFAYLTARLTAPSR